MGTNQVAVLGVRVELLGRYGFGPRPTARKPRPTALNCCLQQKLGGCARLKEAAAADEYQQGRRATHRSKYFVKCFG
jgi:hypothetical protein